MSRSRKKNHWCNDSNPYAKRQANKKVRRYKLEISNGSSYKKIYASYEIKEYKMFNTFEEYTDVDKQNVFCWNMGITSFYTKEELLASWRKCFVSK